MKRYIRATETHGELLGASPEEKMYTAKSGNTPAEILVELSTDGDPFVRGAVAGNTSTPATVLEKLAKDSDTWVRSRAAYNTSTLADTLRQLAHDDSNSVRLAVTMNASTPHDVLEVLTEDDNYDVRRFARKHLNRTSDPSKPKRLSWPKLISQLRSEAEDGVDSLYEQTSAGNEITSLCTDVENKLRIWLEPSIQGGRGGIWFYSSEDDSTLASDYDYQTYNDNVLSIALDSKNVTEFRNKYKSFVQSILNDPAYAPEVDE